MCGIVAYFGGAGNPLTRILTGMSAIIYRAPDSTGIGLFGDDREPIRLRKSLGSVVQLLDVLQTDAVYVRPEAVMTRLQSPRGEKDLEGRQRALLRFEGFEAPAKTVPAAAPDFDALVNLQDPDPARLVPGSPGQALFQDEYQIRSRKDLSTLIQTLIDAYDLSPLVIHTLIRSALADTIARRRETDAVGADETEVLEAFDDLFEATRVGARVKQLRKLTPPGFPKPPNARKALWQNLIETRVRIPADYNRDGVCCLFRLLDAVLLSRMAGDPTLTEALDCALDTMWLPSQRPQRVDWRTLYALEKGLNVYGWAAAAALTYLQQEVFFPVATQEMKRRALMTAESMVPGRTDPQMLRFMATPVIAHGRWAMQSAVTVENAHPFPDARLRRALALNGQFDSRVEARLRTFLETVAGYRLRSENSAEYAAILWGYFFDQLHYEQQHSEVVRRQVDNDMTDIAMGSHSIDYQVVRRVRGRTKTELDRMAFVAAARQIVKDGGQIAVVGVSLVSPRNLFVASHNRPVFVVRRLENDDFMVVSDINAALGLFPQELIEATINALDDLEKQRRTILAQKREAGITPNERRTSQVALADERTRLLAPFAVEVHPLDGEEISALIETSLEGGRVCRTVTISDFDGNPLPDLESFETRLDPVTVRKDVHTSFHETHLREVPERFRYILNVYGPEGPGAEPAVDLNTRVLRRRFGRRLEGLRRLVLVGTGSTFHMAEIARPYLMNLLPDTAVDVLYPGEIEDPSRRFLPQQDLVLMASWSSTTAEMVQLAHQLVAERILIVGLTEKCFADMALAAAKSAGVMPVYSGEEVTIAGIKSTLCMLLCMHILGVWMAAQKGFTEHLEPAFNRLEGLAGRIENINANAEVRSFSTQTAKAMASAAVIIVVTAPSATGLGAEVALKLEEASWYSISQCTTYDDILAGDPGQWSPGRFAIVHATQRENIDTALAAIEKIAAAGIDLAVVTCANRHQERIVALSRGRCLILPREEDHSQVYADIALCYQMAFDLSSACGHSRGEAPRNRTKSPTVTRARSKGRQSPAIELKRLSVASSPASATAAHTQGPKESLHWEKAAATPGLARSFAGLRRAAQTLYHAEPFAGLGAHAEDGVRELGRLLFDRHSEINGLVMVSLDSKAHAVVRDVAAFWRRLLTLPIRELPMGEWPRGLPDDMLEIIVASETRDGFPKEARTAGEGANIFWLGLAPLPWPEPEKHTSGCFVLPPEGKHAAAGSLYVYLHLLFLHAWRAYQPQKAAVVEHLAAGAAFAVEGILNDASLLTALQRVAAANARYQTGFFISPFALSGRTWEMHFDRAGCLAMVHHPPGHLGHGPIVTIDGAVDHKYVVMETRTEMVQRYSEPTVARWEMEFLNGDSIDTFLARPPGGALLRPQAPFYSENRWYLPVLQPGYDARRDNLIFLDMTGDRALPFMLDELSLIGSRAARLVIIIQQARLREIDPKTLFSFPVSDLVVLPSPGNTPIADLHLPLVLNAVGATMAACWKEARSSELDA